MLRDKKPDPTELLQGHNARWGPMHTVCMPPVPVAAAGSRRAPALALIWSVLVLAGAAAGTADADDSTTAKPKASSFAPHHSKSHVYGAPVSKPIMHKRKKRKPPAAAAPAEPIK